MNILTVYWSKKNTHNTNQIRMKIYQLKMQMQVADMKSELFRLQKHLILLLLTKVVSLTQMLLNLLK